MKLPTTVQTSV